MSEPNAAIPHAHMHLVVCSLLPLAYTVFPALIADVRTGCHVTCPPGTTSNVLASFHRARLRRSVLVFLVFLPFLPSF